MPRPGSVDSSALVQKLWSYCDILRDDGLSYADYVEQLTYLLFLKMIDERAAAGTSAVGLPAGRDWPSLKAQTGPALSAHYAELLQALGEQPGLLGLMFRGARNRIKDPQKLRRLVVDLIDQQTWTALDVDVKGAAYEGLLEKTATDTKSGAGQYFTPRPLIGAVVDVIRPKPGETIGDPACGTGGFLLAAHAYVSSNYELDRDQQAFLRHHTLHGVEIVDAAARLCAMNLFLHGIEASDPTTMPIEVRDVLRRPSEQVDVVLANPPFGRRSSGAIFGEDGEEDGRVEMERSDLWASTSNKQLNFLQHIVSMVADGGRAAVVVPDNVLFDGSRAGKLVRQKLLAACDLHTMLRLPTGIFYAQSVKANVLFFDKRSDSPEPATRELWVYDLRTNGRFTRRDRPFTRADLDGFVAAFQPERPRSAREQSSLFKRWTYAELAARPGFDLDIWANAAGGERAELEQLEAPE
ncbi:MAG TPA: class I SAM-dependent DNA methyltransferase, partial [Thermoleophilaceae bacterium]